MKAADKKNRKQNESEGIRKYTEPGLIALLCLIAYQPVFSNGLIDWDDFKYITENALVRDFSLKTLPDIFNTPVMGNYHPLTMLSLALNYKFSGDSATGYHFTNLLLHILNSILVLRIAQYFHLQQMGRRAALILFALHPIHVESVAWAAERKDVLYTFFLLLSWIQYLKYRSASAPDSKMLLYSLLFFIAACLSKGMAVVLPVLLLSGEILSGRTQDKSSLVKSLSPFVVLAIIFGGIAVWAQQIQGGIQTQYDFSFTDRLVIALRGYMFYLQHTLIPLGLSAIYPYPEQADTIPFIWHLQAFAGLLILGAGIYLGLKHRWILFMVLGYTGVIFPVLQLLPVGDAVAADRYYYVASIPVFLGMGWYFSILAEKLGKQILAPSVIIVLVLTGLTWYQSSLWKDELKLFGHTVKYYPESAVAWNNMGAIMQRKQQYAEAIPYYENAIRIRPEYTTALCNLGISYGRTGKMELATQMLEKSISTDSTHAESFGNLGNAYVMSGRREEALKLFQKAVALNPKYVESWYNLGIYYRENKMPEEAVRNFRKSVEIRPVFPEGWWSLSAALFETGDQKGAVQAARTSAKQGNVVAAQWLKANNLE